MKNFDPDRRVFLKVSAGLAGGCLVLGINWSCSADDPSENSTAAVTFTPNAWLSIDGTGKVTVTVAESEMGQGPFTLLPMMVAEELEVAWESIEVRRAPLEPVYGFQLTGGSSSIRKGWATLRQAGALAKMLLLQAAAQRLGVAIEECRAETGTIRHPPSGRRLDYGTLIDLASTLPLPDRASLKEPKEFTLIGTPAPRLDTADKLNGRARFGIDTRLPGMRYATISHCPVPDGRVKHVDATQALGLEGVEEVFSIDRGVVVLARDTWSAFQGRRALKIDWEYPEAREAVSSEGILATLKARRPQASDLIIRQGDPQGRLGDETVSAEYLLPFQAHVAMEPMNCTATLENGVMRVWAPTQSPSAAYEAARQATRSKLSIIAGKLKQKLFDEPDTSIEINTTLLGGGFGRRLEQDFVTEATQIAQRIEGPVQLVWTREEDLQHDFYHPMTLHEMRGALDEQGLPVAWHHIIKGTHAKPEGASSLPYEIPHLQVDRIDIGRPVPTGAWRSVQHAYNAFAVEHFFDELARSGGQDPVELRLRLMTRSPRLKQTLAVAAERAGMARGGLFGAASHASFGSYVSEIVELEEAGRGLRIRRITCVLDCGLVINPDIARAQMEGSIIFGLSAALKSAITIRRGRVEQSNFHDYPILRLEETPPIDVHLIESRENPEGIGEPGVPPLAPALANALFAATGHPLRQLPVTFRDGILHHP